MSKVRDALSERLRVHNSHNYATCGTRLLRRSEQTPVVWYIPADHGRGGRPAVWRVEQPGSKTDPDGPWYNYGHKTFMVARELNLPKDAQFAAALAWASERFGVAEWAKDPWGGYHPAEVVAAVNAALKGGTATEGGTP